MKKTIKAHQEKDAKTKDADEAHKLDPPRLLRCCSSESV